MEELILSKRSTAGISRFRHDEGEVASAKSGGPLPCKVCKKWSVRLVALACGFLSVSAFSGPAHAVAENASSVPGFSWSMGSATGLSAHGIILVVR